MGEQVGFGEPALADFAKNSQFEETVAALAELTAVPIETVERLMAGTLSSRRATYHDRVQAVLATGDRTNCLVWS